MKMLNYLKKICLWKSHNCNYKDKIEDIKQIENDY